MFISLRNFELKRAGLEVLELIVRYPIPTLPPMLLQYSHTLYRHASINRLAHIINRQQANLHGCKCFHFYTGLTCSFALHTAADAVLCFICHKTDIDPA